MGTKAIIITLTLLLGMGIIAFGGEPAAKQHETAAVEPEPAVEAPAAAEEDGDAQQALAEEELPEESLPKGEYVGSETCLGCHEDAKKKIEKSTMGKALFVAPKTELEKRGCEACHGPSSLHLEDPTDKKAQVRFDAKSETPIKVQNEACLQCHDKGEHIWWKGSTHEKRDVACVKCHKIHSGEQDITLNAKDQQTLCQQCHPQRKAQSLHNSHMPLREGKMDCTDCHSPHGSTGPAMVKANSTNELCYQCHAEKRGPFLWEHPPVMENCSNCHEPHGSIRANLLKVKAERLCQRCHAGGRHPSTPHESVSRYVYNHSCVNCHSQFHGSNHPAGNYFFR